MHARQVLQVLKTAFERGVDINPDDIHVSLSGDNKNASAIVTVPIEGKTRIIEIRAKEICVHEGLTGS